MPVADDRYACLDRRTDQNAFSSAQRHYPPDLELEPVHLDVDLHVDLEGQTVCGTVTNSVRAKVPGNHAITLNAVDFRDVVVAGSDNQKLQWTYDGHRIRVTWKKPFECGEERQVAVTYLVERPSTGLYFSKPNTAYPNARWFATTDHETERARHWLPCVDFPAVRTPLDFHLRAEKRFTILANGSLAKEVEHSNGTKTAHWRLEQPCASYLACFAIGDFVVADDGDFDGIPLSYFATKNFTPEDLVRSFGRTKEMLQWLTDKLGTPFPYPKYFQIALPVGGGAMENISLVSWDERFILDEKLATEMERTVDQINIHEMAHSYFGDWLVIRDFAHAWLKESWATYIESCWLEDKRGPDEALYDFYLNAQAYFTEADERYQRPIVTRQFNHSWEMYDYHLYPGGACRLHTLRHELGDDIFWAAVRDYVASFGGDVVETNDFRRIMEKHSGRSLGRFFDQWFKSKGYPSLKISFKYEADRNKGVFDIEQTQVDEKKDIPVFDLNLDIAWVIDSEMSSRTVKLDKKKVSLVVDMESDPEIVRIDPHAKVLHKLELNPGDDKLKRQLTESPDVIGRIQAGVELAKTGRAQNIEAMAEAYSSELFWGVRVQWIKALGKAGTQSAIIALTEMIHTEKDPLVLRPLMGAATEYRDPNLAKAVQAKLDAGLPYCAEQTAYRALGAQRDRAPFDRLAKAAAVEGFGGFAQSGALAGLALTRRNEAIDILKQFSTAGAAAQHVRVAALMALASLGRTRRSDKREAIVEHVVDLLRDPSESIRHAAVKALQAVGDPRAIPALRAHRASISAQFKGNLDKAIKAIESAQKPKVPKLEKRIDELQDRLRKLEDEVRRLKADAGPVSTTVQVKVPPTED